jgi:uncharacterized protein (TIGR02246 family)
VVKGRLAAGAAVAVLVSAPAWSAAASECRAEAAGVREIRSVATGIVAADNQRDLERVLAFYADDAILMPPGEGPVAGRARIRPRYEALFASVTPEIQVHIDEACVDGSMGFVRGRNGGRVVARDTGEPRTLDDAFLMLLRRGTDGAWRISHLMWHRQTAPAVR